MAAAADAASWPTVLESVVDELPARARWGREDDRLRWAGAATSTMSPTYGAGGGGGLAGDEAAAAVSWLAACSSPRP